jgi:hypothetical protein
MEMLRARSDGQPRCRLLCYTLELTLFFVTLFAAAAPTWATPPLVSNPSPYDADWPTVHWVLMTKCRRCHHPDQDERQDLSTYAALMSACLDGDADMPVIAPEHPERSCFWDCVRWNAQADENSDLPDSPEMPPETHEWLTAGQLATLHRWISAGARAIRHEMACEAAPLSEIDFPSAKNSRSIRVSRRDRADTPCAVVTRSAKSRKPRKLRSTRS